MAYTLKSLNDLSEQLQRTAVISKEFKAVIMKYALDVVCEVVQNSTHNTDCPKLHGGKCCLTNSIKELFYGQ